MSVADWKEAESLWRRLWPRKSPKGRCFYGTLGAAFAGALAGASAGAAIANAVADDDEWKLVVIVMLAVIGFLGGFGAGVSLACFPKDER